MVSWSSSDICSWKTLVWAFVFYYVIITLWSHTVISYMQLKPAQAWLVQLELGTRGKPESFQFQTLVPRLLHILHNLLLRIWDFMTCPDPSSPHKVLSCVLSTVERFLLHGPMSQQFYLQSAAGARHWCFIKHNSWIMGVKYSIWGGGGGGQWMSHIGRDKKGVDQYWDGEQGGGGGGGGHEWWWRLYIV